MCSQVVFPMMGYVDWQGLSSTALRVKAAPFRLIVKEEWARLRRAFPEMQSAAKPFVKEKWDETAFFLVQVREGQRVRASREGAGYG
jgi:hypothetical protein